VKINLLHVTEFNLITKHFTRPTSSTALGIGDDAALLRVADGVELVVTTDMLVSGTHFFADADPFLLGHKALAVNLSDLAAMGATPRWATLALSLPQADEHWLSEFSRGFFALAEQFYVALVGGDTTRGALNVCVTAMGEAPRGAALRRDGAQVGDDIWVSGQLGDAALALAHLNGEATLSEPDFAACASRLHRPEPRVALGLALRGIANSAIDVSDGLLADLGHILNRSRVAAEIAFADLPVSDALRPHCSQPVGMRCLLAGGDDYELCFTAPPANRARLAALATKVLNLPLTRIGVITAGDGCAVRAADGSVIDMKATGYDHFR
jgi:thiamine-monophosphate kinase